MENLLYKDEVGSYQKFPPSQSKVLELLQAGLTGQPGDWLLAESCKYEPQLAGESPIES